MVFLNTSRIVISLIIVTLTLRARAASIGVQNCCGDLHNLFPSLVSFPNSTNYNSTLYSYYTAQEVSIDPACFFSPGSESDIASTLSLFSQHKCSFAIKSGGHGIWGGIANIQNGVSIDLAKFNALGVASRGNETVVKIGVGMKWGQVYQLLDAQGLAVPGGRWGGVGVGGLTLGGGISFFSTRVGFVCDNIVNAQVVLASGKIVNANATSHPELWRALKGGSNNFGVVTRLDLLAFPQGKFWGGQVIQPYTPATLDHFVDAVSTYSSDPEFDIYASLIFSYVFNSGSWIFISNVQYTQENNFPSTLAPFTDYEPDTQVQNTVRFSNLSDFADTNSDADGPNGATRNFYFTRTYGSSPVLIRQMYNLHNETVSKTVSLLTEAVSWSLTAEPFPTVLTQWGDRKGGNVLGLHADDGPLILWLVTVFWHDPTNDAMIAKAVSDFFSKIDSLAQELGLYNSYSYLNYADKTEPVIEGYGAENVAFLRAVSKKYDSQGVFQKLVPGGFKLGV
ncbi:FAD binding domain containing protein [Rutstroemia sp. NJR-2017a WRK4]|nr:FAD binding domain containing protein [Rutstroemia sp. NJR-2017a WRK4]PQE11740.1 FAD binding domain containing protein [Rutstroemia sp. NJR-2017a WRK4]